MLPPVAIAVISGIQLAIQAAPHIAELAIKGKEMISALFGGGVITAEQQNTLDDRVDLIALSARAGRLPPSWAVEADPE